MRRQRFVIVSAWAAWLLAAGCGESVTAPKEFKEFSANDGSFKCQYPAGWEVEGGGGTRTEYSMTKFTKGSAEIRVEADLAGSLFGDIAKSTGGRFGDDEPPVARVHPMKLKSMKDEFDNYTERDPKPFKSPVGEGRKSIFIAAGSLGSKVYGYRATLLTGDKRLTILCYCAAADWKTLRPAFDKVLQSMSR